MTRVLVLGGGPDAERPVSLASANAIAQALQDAGYAVNAQTIDRPSATELAGLDGDVIFPVLHGVYGEGGPLQDLLAADGRAFVGSGPRAARLAMDKMATKVIAASCGAQVGADLGIAVPTPWAALLDPADAVCPLELPVVVKPVREGSSVGLRLCRDGQAWSEAVEAVRAQRDDSPAGAYMVEQLIEGRELTVSVLDGRALPIVEISPAQGVYDYQAKYDRGDTGYTLDPVLPAGVGEAISAVAVRLARALGVRHLARVDVMLDRAGVPWVLELNTMPGFTGTSLFPMAAARAGLTMPVVCDRLVQLAQRDASGRAGKKRALSAHMVASRMSRTR